MGILVPVIGLVAAALLGYLVYVLFRGDEL